MRGRRSRHRHDSMGAVNVPASGTYRRSDDLVRTQLVHQQAYSRDVRNCILVPYFMEMYLLDRFRMDVALRLGDDIVHSKNISLDLLGDIHTGHDSPDVTHSRVVVMMGVTMVVVMVMVMIMFMVMLMAMVVVMFMIMAVVMIMVMFVVVVMFMVMLMAMVMAVPMIVSMLMAVIVSMLMAVIMLHFFLTIYLHRNLCAGYP